MPLVVVALLAGLAGLTEALAVSSSGHAAVARLWVDASAGRGAVAAVAQIGAALGLILATRRPLRDALGEGVRAVARPSLFAASPAAQDALVLGIGVAVSLLVGSVTSPRVELWAASPTAAGAGLCVTGLAIASTALAPRVDGERRPRPTLVGAVLVGVAHGLAVFPGASRVGAALTVLLWMGQRPARSVALACLLTAPVLVLGAVGAGGAPIGAGRSFLAVACALVTAVLGAEGLRALAERRRTAVLAALPLSLGLALIAYARALPHAP